MYKARAALIGLVVAILIQPSPVLAAYTYLGNALGPLAFIDPVMPGQVFKVWSPEAVGKGRWTVGASADFLRYEDNSDDVDVIASITGVYGISDRLSVGGILPYIVRDPEFNESDLLDLRAFARYRFTGGTTGPGLGAELMASFPTAAQGGTYPFTLDTTLVKLSLAASGSISGWDCGLNLGYQTYLESETGDDSDLLYGFFAGREVAPNLTGVLEYAASRHTHSEGALEEEVTDATVLAGVKYRFRESLVAGLGVGSGLSDSVVGLRSQATLLWVPGGRAAPPAAPAVEAAVPEAAPEPPPTPGRDLLASIEPGRGNILVQVSNRSGDRRLGERVARHLQEAGYAVPVVEEGSGEQWERSYIYYGRNKLAEATGIKLLFGRPEALKRVPSRLKGVGVIVVLGKDLAGWRR